MPKAEVGTTKHLSNKLKSKGLQRLRWFCQPCERQMRDENGFKCHVQSESHYRTMLAVGENPNKVINDFTKQFEHDFLQLLRTSHNTKAVQINHFYQSYIANKEHVHMNATKYKSLTDFAKYLGTSGICRVEENEKGIFIAWIDNSPEALRRQDAVRKRERMDKGDEEREQRQILERIRRAQGVASAQDEADEAARELQRVEGEKIKLDFGGKKAVAGGDLSTPPRTSNGEDATASKTDEAKSAEGVATTIQTVPEMSTSAVPAAAAPVKMSLGSIGAKPRNVFAAGPKKNALAAKKSSFVEPPKKMSEAERIMKEEMERKRDRQGESAISFGAKRQRVA